MARGAIVSTAVPLELTRAPLFSGAVEVLYATSSDDAKNGDRPDTVTRTSDALSGLICALVMRRVRPSTVTVRREVSSAPPPAT